MTLQVILISDSIRQFWTKIPALILRPAFRFAIKGTKKGTLEVRVLGLMCKPHWKALSVFPIPFVDQFLSSVDGPIAQIVSVVMEGQGLHPSLPQLAMQLSLTLREAGK